MKTTKNANRLFGLRFSTVRKIVTGILAIAVGSGLFHLQNSKDTTAPDTPTGNTHKQSSTQPTGGSRGGSSPEPTTHTGKVIRVADGDTIVLSNRNGKDTRIRLYGVDAPESAQRGGKESQKFTSDLVYHKDVNVRTVYLDQYGRDVAIVTLQDGKILNEELIRNGHAWVYKNYCDTPECSAWRKLEHEAKAEMRGLWGAPNPTAPWNWRKQHPRE